MRVGIPKEIKTLEFRVGMTPAGVHELVHDGHEVIVETNAAVPNPPFNGTVFEFEPTRIASIGGLSVTPGSLIAIIGSPLVSYVNVIDSSTVFYGLVVDQRASGGLRLETALAGGAACCATVVTVSSLGHTIVRRSCVVVPSTPGVGDSVSDVGPGRMQQRKNLTENEAVPGE